MAFLFSRTKSDGNVDAVKRVIDSLAILRIPPETTAKAETVTKHLSALKVMIVGSYDQDPKPGQVAEIVQQMIKQDFFLNVAHCMHMLNFLGRKDAQTIFSYAFRFRPENSVEESTPAIRFVLDQRPEVIVQLCRGYEHKESAMPCGTVLREILKIKEVIEIILYDESQEGEAAVKPAQIDLDVMQSGEGVFWSFFDWIDRGAFEVSADAFTTFREILTKENSITCHYLSTNFDLFFERYNRVLVNSSSYVTKRQSIKLLGELLLDRVNYNVMTEYVDRGDHLKICMNLLRDDRKMVQYEGFHVFKVFVANPKKSEAVTKILRQNRERLLRFLPTFLDDRTEDDQFLDEKAFLIRQIEGLPTMIGQAPATSTHYG